MTEVGCDPELSQLSHPNPDQAKEGNIGMQQSPRSQGQRREQQTAPFAGGELWKVGGGDMGKEAGLGQEWQHTRGIIVL